MCIDTKHPSTLQCSKLICYVNRAGTQFSCAILRSSTIALKDTHVAFAIRTQSQRFLNDRPITAVSWIMLQVGQHDVN